MPIINFVYSVELLLFIGFTVGVEIMLGIYNYTVIITYLSVVSASVGMYFSVSGQMKAAIFCLMFSGLCDSLDGPVARTLKTRTETDKKFGIQIDSLCDCVSFGVQPAVLVFFISRYYAPGFQWIRITALIAGIILVLGGIIRLAYFNVCEEERQKVDGDKVRTGYRGLPITNTVFTIPLGFLFNYFTDGIAFVIIMIAVEIITAVLFVTDFSFPKVHGKKLIPVVLGGLALFIGICFI